MEHINPGEGKPQKDRSKVCSVFFAFFVGNLYLPVPRCRRYEVAGRVASSRTLARSPFRKVGFWTDGAASPVDPVR